jgi:hypothetical protein
MGMMFAAMTRIPPRTARPTTTAGKSTPPATTSPAPLRRRRFRLLLLLPLLSAAAAFGWFGLERRPEALCRQWEREARTAEGERLTEIITRLDAYGRYGLPCVVRLLDADREATTEAAGKVLAARLRLVGRNGGGDDRPAAALIADELRRLVAGRSQSVSPATVDVALQLLEAVGRLGLADAVDDAVRDRLLSAADEVLRLSPARPDSPLTMLVDADRPPLPPAPPVGTVPSEIDRARIETDARASESKVIVASAPTATPSPALAPTADEPTPPPTIAANTAARINPVRDAAADRDVRPATATASLPSKQEIVRPDSTRGDAWSLFAALHDDASQVAEQELRRRGFSLPEIELGRHLCSPDFKERRHYASLLPTLGGVDARPWLLYLSRDEDADVRLTVAAIMATSNDPELQARVRSMSIDDRDQRVRTTAARAVDTRTLRR